MTARARKVRRNLMSAEDIKLSLYEEKKRKPPPAQTSDDFRKPPMLRKPLMLHCLHEVHWKPRILFWPSTNCTFCNLWRRRFGFQLYFCSCWCCWELLLRTNLLLCYEVHVCTYRNTYRICYFVILRSVQPTLCHLLQARSGLQVGLCICVFIVLLVTGCARGF